MLHRVRIWRSRKLADADTKFTDSPVKLTHLARTIIDLAAVLNERALRFAIDSAQQQNRAYLNWIHRVFKQQGNGRRGAPMLEKILREYEERNAVPDNPLESIGLELANRLPVKPEVQYQICDDRGHMARVDLAWPKARLCVEFDGWTDSQSERGSSRQASMTSQATRHSAIKFAAPTARTSANRALMRRPFSGPSLRPWPAPAQPETSSTSAASTASTAPLTIVTPSRPTTSPSRRLSPCTVEQTAIRRSFRKSPATRTPTGVCRSTTN